MRKVILILIPLLVLAGCGEVTKVFKKTTPYEEYKESLEKAGLLKTALGSEWVKAGTDVLKDSSIINTPFRERGYFPSNKARASAYRFEANRGEQLNVSIVTAQPDTFLIFADLFHFEEGPAYPPEQAASMAKADSVLSYEVSENGIYLLRLQPELLKGGEYELIITKGPSLAFPVAGKDSRDIKSFWGDSRDGGRRDHKGVDIFAAKGTPVTAAADGMITRTGTNRLGGKVVWLNTGRFSFYYAHLDSQLVSPGRVVQTGDTLGLIGNTGNARFTPPHLHFGIYVPGEGAINPYPFIKDDYVTPPPVKTNRFRPGEMVRIKSNTGLKLNPYNTSNNIVQLKKNTPGEILSAAGDYFKISFPGNLEGYIAVNAVESLEAPILTKLLTPGDEIADQPGDNYQRIKVIGNSGKAEVYGSYNGYYLIKSDENFGWVKI